MAFSCQKLSQTWECAFNLNDIAVLNINGADYCCIINGFSKSDGVNLIHHASLIEGKRVL